jgi:hypothetical protein
MTKQQFLSEEVEDLDYVVEADHQGKKRLFVTGVFAVSGRPNKNKRLYPHAVLRNEVNRFVKENVQADRAYGTLGHDIGPNIDMQKICFKIVDLKEDRHDEGIFHGKALVTSTPCGEIIRGLINDGCNLGVSTRALGSLKPIPNSQLSEVGNDLRILSVDAVCDPSAPGAFVSGLMEGAQWVWNSSTNQYIRESTEDMRRRMIRMTMKEIERSKMKLFHEFISLQESI